ncbi:MAG: GNAT family N-acetyltransferase [Bacteroidetes bacterium]|nr:GNAT family N-acetyltransferase [Bacteroidota bacterium]
MPKKEYRKKGFGTQIVNKIIELARKESIKYLKIEVNKDQDISNAFWSSFEFEFSSKNRNIYKLKIF